MNNAWYFSETEWNVLGWLILETVLSNCYKCLWTQGFVSFFCISIYNSLKLISPRIVLLLSIFMKVVTITLTFILTFFTSYLLVISFVFFIENIDSLLKTSLKKNWHLSSKNVGKWDCSDKWNTDRAVLLWLRSTKDRLHCCIFPGISSFIGWKHLYWNNCIASLFISDSWLVSGPLGQALCKLVSFSIEVSTVVSSQSLVLIAVDRFGTVVFPLRSPLISSNQCQFFILATWVIAMVVGCPVLFFFKVLEYPDGLVCTPLWFPYFKHYTVSMIAVVFYVPLVLITILYLTIAITIKSQKTAGEQSVSRRGQRIKREKIVLKISIAIVSAFTMGWLPLSIWWLVYFYSSDKTVIWSCGFQYFTEIVGFWCTHTVL